MTTAVDIVRGINAALARIRIADGYWTDLGLLPIAFGLDMPDENNDGPVVSVFVPDENLDRERSNTTHRDLKSNVLIAYWYRPNVENGVEDATQGLFALLDIKRALFRRGQVPEIDPLVIEYRYEGASFLPRPPGGTFAQAVVEGLFRWREDL